MLYSRRRKSGKRGREEKEDGKVKKDSERGRVGEGEKKNEKD